ncbi:MAG TPA: AGE family epimerase/isomerase [Terricaulis sp.]|nr:AGE family epimerase/isomerase [Terricaulis sp.]
MASPPSPEQRLQARAEQARTWLFDAAFPLWSARAFDVARGCFFERIGADGAPLLEPTRVRVQARQTAVFAIAGQLGWQGPWADTVEAGLGVLRTRCLRADGGNHHTLGVDGAPLDQRRHLYDLAFILFALANAAAALGQRRDLIAAADAQLSWLDTHWAHAHGGYHEGEVAPNPPRRQNPHMHLFEALLALYEATGAAPYLQRAAAIHELAITHFYDAEHGVVREFFQEDLRPAAGAQGAYIEPGHLFEWSWLLDRYSRLSGEALPPAAARLCAEAERRGVNPATGAVYNACTLDGSVRDADSRLWTHTERLKAHLAAFARTQEPAHAEAAVHAFDTLMRFCDTPIKGLWRDRMVSDGTLIDEPAPASSFYHIVLGMAELIGVAATR